MDLSYFITESGIAFKDIDGVYMDGEKVAISNGSVNGYIRYAGDITFSPESLCDGVYTVETELIFVGAAPKCKEDDIYLQLMQSGGCNDSITSITFDKNKIAESEGINLEQLAKFSDVLLVMMTYTETKMQIYDPKCDYSIC